MVVFFSVVGPMLAGLGALFLTYDVLSGPRRWYSYYFFHRGHLDMLDQTRKSVTNIYKDMAAPSGIDLNEWLQKKNEWLQQADLEYETMRKDVESKFAEKDLAEREKAFTLGIWGLLMIALGSFMQAVAALLSVQW